MRLCTSVGYPGGEARRRREGGIQKVSASVWWGVRGVESSSRLSRDSIVTLESRRRLRRRLRRRVQSAHSSIGRFHSSRARRISMGERRPFRSRSMDWKALNMFPVAKREFKLSVAI